MLSCRSSGNGWNSGASPWEKGTHGHSDCSSHCPFKKSAVCCRIYSEPSVQRHHLFPKMLPLKWFLYCKKSLMDRMICKKGLVLFLFPYRTLCFGYLLESPHWGDSNKYPKHMLLEVLLQYSCIISPQQSPLERRLLDIQNVISSVGLKRVDCIYEHQIYLCWLD